MGSCLFLLSRKGFVVKGLLRIPIPVDIINSTISVPEPFSDLRVRLRGLVLYSLTVIIPYPTKLSALIDSLAYEITIFHLMLGISGRRRIVLRRRSRPGS